MAGAIAPALLALAGLAAGLTAACAPPAHHGPPVPVQRRLIERIDPFVSSARMYERMGLIAVAGRFPLVGRITFLASPAPDSTLTLVALAFPSRALTITASGATYEATYDVAIDVTRAGRLVRHIDTTATVPLDRSAPLHEIVFQDALGLEPGDYRVSVVIHDPPSARTAAHAGPLAVPRLDARTSSSPIPAHDATARHTLDSLPRLAQWPAATAIVGRDSILPIYIEYLGDARCPLRLQARDKDGGIVWYDSVTLVRTGALCAALTPIPVTHLGPGAMTLEVIDPAGDTTTAPIFVTLDADVPVSAYDQQLDYLRYFTAPATLAALRATSAPQRGAAWTAFLDRVGLDSLTTYLQVLHRTDARFPDEGIPGWQTARGRVYITLGEPEQIFQETTTHRQIWNYLRYLTRLVFVDDSGTGHWRLTPRSETDYEVLLRRVHR
jgi:GWxTD domain-containing protein